MNTDKLIFAVIAGVTILITAVIFMTSFTNKSTSEISDVIGPEPHIKGNPDAPLTIVEFSDFECPYCVQYASILTGLVENYPDQLSFVYRHFPLISIHPYAIPTARASEAAAKQGKFWEYHDQLFLNQGKFENEDLIKYAEEVGLNIDQFESDLGSADVSQKVQEDADTARELNLSATPTFFTVYNGETERVVLQNYGDLENRIAEILGAPASVNDSENGMQTEPTTDNTSAAMPAILDLVNVKRDDLAPSEVEVVSVEQVEWPDASLGCPEEGQLYAQVVTPGYNIVLSVSGEIYEYHTDESGEAVVLCE